MTAIFSIVYWLFFVLSAIALFPVALLIRLVTAPFDRNRRRLHLFTCWWSRLYLKVLPGCRLRVEGREKIPAGACVFTPNHQSLTDIMALGALATPFKHVSKKEVFRIPSIGWNMTLNGYVSVDRGNIRSVKATMDICRAWLDAGVPLMMFPEGTRSKTGELAEFHPGPFKLAIEKKCPVVPVVIDGTLPIYRGWKVSAFPGTVTVRVLDPVSPEGAGNAEKLKEMVRERMKAELAEFRGGSGAEGTGGRAAPDR